MKKTNKKKNKAKRREQVPVTDIDDLQARLLASHMRLPLSLIDNYMGVQPKKRVYKYTREQISKYLQQPANYEKALRDISIYMYTNSMHYYNLINFFALMPTWDYAIVPTEYARGKKDSQLLYDRYTWTANYVARMNIKHEFIKIMRTCFREDVFYGICYENNNAFFIKKLDPDYCQISSIEDGVFNFAFNFGAITEEELALYPEFFREMWEEYQRGGDLLRWQEIPADIGICIKLNEDLDYIVPPFADVMELLYDIDDYADLLKERAQIDIYKLLHMKIPIDDKMEPMAWDLAQRYYEQASKVIPANIGLIMNPMDIEDIKFEKTGLTDTDEVAQAEQRFWTASGTSPLLFGDNTGSVTALKLSVKGNEQIVLALMRQIERWLNRRLRNKAKKKVYFKASILPVTHFNWDEKVNAYKEAALYGQPVKTIYAATQDLEPGDVAAMAFLENEILDYPNTLVPLQSSYTQSSDEGGRPTNESKGIDLTPSGEQTQRNESNQKRWTQ